MTAIAIVGGGFTGLSAAYHLSKRDGVEVTVLEAAADLGGLASGFELAGQPAEKAYHFLYKTDEYMLALVDELGLNDKLHYHESSLSTYYDGTLYPMMTPLDLLKFKPLKPWNRIRAGVSVLYLQQVRSWEKLTKITALDWLRKWAGREVTDVIWEPLLKGKFDRYYDQVTMAWLWGRVKQRVESRDRGDTTEKLGYFDGGFASLVDELVGRATTQGATFHTSSPVGAIERLESGKVKVTSAAVVGEFDAVLMTTPSTVAAKLLAPFRSADPAYFEKLEAIDYLDAAVMVFVSDTEISPYYWHNINSPDAPFVVFLSLTALTGTEAFGGKHVYYIGDYIPREHWYMSAERDELADHWFNELGQIFPDFNRSSVVEDHVFRFKDAQHIVDIGFEEKLAPHQTPCPGVYLANFSQIFPMDRGTNYAVRDGALMSELILSDIG